MTYGHYTAYQIWSTTTSFEASSRWCWDEILIKSHRKKKGQTWIFVTIKDQLFIQYSKTIGSWWIHPRFFYLPLFWLGSDLSHPPLKHAQDIPCQWFPVYPGLFVCGTAPSPWWIGSSICEQNIPRTVSEDSPNKIRNYSKIVKITPQKKVQNTSTWNDHVLNIFLRLNTKSQGSMKIS